jgi:hypothetical protein
MADDWRVRYQGHSRRASSDAARQLVTHLGHSPRLAAAMQKTIGRIKAVLIFSVIGSVI